MINLIQGDCLEKMKEIPDGSVDMILTDPPYGTTACKWDSIIPLEPMWEQLKRIIKPNGAIVLFGSEPFSSAVRSSNYKMFKYDWVWDKNRVTGALNAKKQPLRCYEVISVFYLKQPVYKPQGLIDFIKNNSTGVLKNGRSHETTGKINQTENGKYKQTKAGYPKNIIRMSSEVGNVHPTQKPVALMEYLIKTYTNENETVLDFTMGSGTTGVAAKNLNRSFIGIELDENYFDIAKERIGGIVCGTK